MLWLIIISSKKGFRRILKPFYMPNKIPAILKYISKEQASTIVVINGDAITAGSKPIFLASIGRVQPTSLATVIVINKVPHTTKEIVNDKWLNNINLAKLAIARVNPHKRATLSSFHITLKVSLYSISSNDNERITDTLAWEPALPPESISIGINDVSTT